jgi:hypothetical protein
MDTTTTVLTAILCISGPLFFISTVVLAIILYAQHNKNRLHNKSFTEQKQTLESKIRELDNRITVISNNVVADFCLRWCKEAEFASYSSEIEVEIKFIYPFMRFLGYKIDELQTRVSVEVPIGRKKISAIADWVVHNHEKKPFLVIEAKEPNQQLNIAVQDQARSYAFALNAPFYMLTNGRQVAIFERRIDSDTCILNLNVKDLPNQWQKIEQIIGKR